MNLKSEFTWDWQSHERATPLELQEAFLVIIYFKASQNIISIEQIIFVKLQNCDYKTKQKK